MKKRDFDVRSIESPSPSASARTLKAAGMGMVATAPRHSFSGGQALSVAAILEAPGEVVADSAHILLYCVPMRSEEDMSSSQRGREGRKKIRELSLKKLLYYLIKL
jgi:hypothetical protein